MSPLRMREYIGCEEEVTLLKSQRDCAIEAERRDATRIMEALAGAHVCTPEETYGSNTSWAISDLIRAFKSQPKIEEIQRLYLLVELMAGDNDPGIKYFAERVQHQIQLAFPVRSLRRRGPETRGRSGMAVLCESVERESGMRITQKEIQDQLWVSQYAENNVRDLGQAIHLLNERWWTDIHTGKRLKRNVGELLMLCVSELAEAMEGDRKGLMDDKLPERPMLEVELADCIIRILDMGVGLELDVPGAITAKLKYNAEREDHKHAARLLTGGKKY